MVMSSISINAQSNTYGLEAITQLELLPYLRSDYIAMMESSRDPDGGNEDFRNFRYKDEDEYVFAKLTGPGIIDRIWFTGIDPADKLYFYFDDEETPRINTTMNTFFKGYLSNLRQPLIVDPDISSGGYISYMPFPFEKSIKITTSGNLMTGGGAVYFHNISYKKIANSNSIKTWDGSDDEADALKIWGNTGKDPKQLEDIVLKEKIFDLPAGENVTLYDESNGAKMITKLLIGVNELVFNDDNQNKAVMDDGRAFMSASGMSEFDVSINTANKGVKLVRRLDFGIANQTADVYVDDLLVGRWQTPHSDAVYRWLDSEFEIPASFTDQKNSIHIKIKFISSILDWNEFYYWVYSNENDEYILTDELDIKNLSSELAHNYNILGQTWEGTQSFYYPSVQSNLELNQNILKNIWLKISWDNEPKPSVEAPIGMFFGMGALNANSFKSLPVGVTDDYKFYSYWPMIYGESAKIELENRSDSSLNSVNFSLSGVDFIDSLDKVGQFKTAYHEEIPTIFKKEYIFLETEGTGHYVGTVLNGEYANSGYLEGDERFYIDDVKTPWIYGTGTEDYFNGAWYFLNGRFGLASHGLSSQVGDHRSMYRFHLTDPIPFMSSGRFGIEHGPQNESTADYQSLAFYYLKKDNTPSIELSDQLNVVNSSDIQAHDYSVTNKTEEYTLNNYYEGFNDKSIVSDNGLKHKGESQFTVSINSKNKGVRLLRQFDYSILNQNAEVYVDDDLVGTWYSAGKNTVKKWRDEMFLIPISFTKDKNEIQITIKVDPLSSEWSEFNYKIYSILNEFADITENSEDNYLLPSFKLNEPYPNPFHSSTTISFQLPTNTEVELNVFNFSGQKVATLINSETLLAGEHKIKFNASYLTSGLYMYQLKAGGIVSSKKIVLID